MSVVSFHFHGYQPGDIVRWIEEDPLKPPRFEERNSPVAHTIGSARATGRNWTDAVLRAYGQMERALEEVAGAASVDVEPQTLAWLLDADADSYRRVLAGWEKGVAGLVMTPPFHPILPHHHRQERNALFAMMIDFYAPLLRRQNAGPIGLWLPEAAYSSDVARDYLAAGRRAAGGYEGLPDLVNKVHLILDERQLAKRGAEGAWHRLGIDGGLPFVVRDHGLSGDFAFGGSNAGEFAAAARARGADSLLVASDLESLLANPSQAERFDAIVDALHGTGADVTSPTPATERPVAEIVEYSSWSDYDEHTHHGHTSDTRWTGMRRSDGLVISRPHRGEPTSQLWKHALALATEQIETVVRRATLGLLAGVEAERRPDVLRRLAVAYGRHLFQAHYRENGFSSGDVDFARAAERILGGAVDVEVAGYAARAYTMMLMGLRSDPRFWDNPDTRVTFQNVVCLTQALLDAAEAVKRSGMRDGADRLLHVVQITLLDFRNGFERSRFSELHGAEGWETTEEAWFRSLATEVPQRSAHDVVRRATLWAVGEEVRRTLDPSVRSEGLAADTGHIAGETHGDWANRDWCEHRARRR